MTDTVRRQTEFDIQSGGSDTSLDSPLFELDLFTDFNRTRSSEPEPTDQINFDLELDIFDFSVNSLLETSNPGSTEATLSEADGEARNAGDDLTFEVLSAGTDVPRVHLEPDGPRPFNDESTRLRIVTPQNFAALLEAAGTNPCARDLLRDLSSESNGLTTSNDPMKSAIRLVLRRHPEMKESLTQAVISSCADGSNKKLISAIADIAKSDPNLATDLRNAIITPALNSRETSNRHQGTELLMAIAGQWTTRDFVNAVNSLEPDQVLPMRTAVNSAPPEVQSFFRNALLDSTMTRGNRPLDSMRPRQFQQSNDAFDARLQLLAAQPEAFEGYLRRPLNHEGPESLLSALDSPRSPGGLEALFPALRRREPNAADQALVARAFPGSQPAGTADRMRPEAGIDTGYLALVLDRGITDAVEKPATATDVFRDWGIDIGTHSQEVESAVQRYGAENILTLARRLTLHNALDDSLRQELTGSPDKISPEQLAGVILNGQLGEEGTVGAALLDEPPLEVRLRTMGETNTRTLAAERDNLFQNGVDRRQSLSSLSDHARTGVSALGLLDHAVDTVLERGLMGVISPVLGTDLVSPTLGNGRLRLRTSTVERFEDNQEGFIDAFRSGNQQFQQQAGLVGNLSRRQANLDFSQNVYAYEQLRQSGTSQLRQDYMALAMLDRYGIESIKQFAPQIWTDLTAGSGLQRLEDNKLIQSHSLPEFSGSPQRQREEALTTLTNLRAGGSGNLDLPIRRNQALAVLDAQPESVRAQNIAVRFGEQFADFTTLLEAGRAGTKYEEYVRLVQENAHGLEQILDAVKPEDVQALKASVTELQRSEEAATDPQTREALETRHRAMSSILNILDPQSPQHKAIKEVLTSAQSREFREDTFGNWLSENGPVIAAAAAAVAVTIASVGTASPLTVVLLSSAAALGSSQLTKEALYQINHHIGDTGIGGYADRSYAGEWVNKHWQNFEGLATSADWSGTENNAKELLTSFLSEVAGPLTMEYGQNVIMGLVGLGALKLTQAGLKGVSPQVVRSLVEQPQARSTLRALYAPGANPAASAFTRQWLGEVSRETGQKVAKEVTEEVAEEGVQTIGERALQDVGVGGPAASLLMTVSMTLLQGRRGSRGSETSAMFTGDANGGRLRLSDNVGVDAIRDLRRAGYRVDQTNDGTYTASTFDSSRPILEIEIARPDEHAVPSRVDTGSTRAEADSQGPDTDSSRTDTDSARTDTDSARTDIDSARTDTDPTRTLADQADTSLDVANDEFTSSLLNAENMRQSVDQLHRTIENLPDRFDDARLELELSDALLDITNRLGLPAPTITVRPDSPRSLATYQDGNIEVNESIARQARENPNILVSSILHELTHLEQETLVLRRTADLLDQGSANGGASDATDFNERVRENYFAETGRTVSPELVSYVMALRNRVPLNTTQAQRADTLAQSFRSYSEGRQAEIRTQQETIRLNQALNNIDRPSGSNTDSTYYLGANDAQRRERIGSLLGTDPIPDLHDALDALKQAEEAGASDTGKLEQDVVDALKLAIRSRVFEINYQSFQTYSNRPHEMEAHDIDQSASSSTPSNFRVDDLDGPSDSPNNIDVTDPSLEIESRRRPSNRGNTKPPSSGEPTNWYASSLGEGTWEGNKYPDYRRGVKIFRNDDRVWTSSDPEHLVVAVMDGLGSDNHRGSEIAADVMRSALDRNWSNYPADGTVDDVKHWMARTVNQGHNQVRMLQDMATHAADAGLNLNYRDPGGDLTVGPKIQTTAVIAALHQDKLLVAWSGDSRAYLFRNGQLHQLTVDDTPPGQPGHIVTNTIGSKKVNLHVKQFAVEQGDRFIVATDGLETLTPDEIAEVMRRSPTAEEGQKALFDAVKAKGKAYQDNLTGVVFDVEPKPAPPPNDAQEPARRPRTKLSEILTQWTSGQVDGIPYVMNGLKRAPSLEFQLNLVDRAAEKLEQHPGHNRRLMIAISNDRTLPDAVRDKALTYLMTN